MKKRSSDEVRYRAISHVERAKLCSIAGVKNTGRQWNRLRKREGFALHVWTTDSHDQVIVARQMRFMALKERTKG